IHVRQPGVNKGDRKGGLGDRRDRAPRRINGRHGAAETSESDLENPTHVQVVIDDQDRLRHGRDRKRSQVSKPPRALAPAPGSRAIGMCTTNVVPLRDVRTSTLPPCWRTMECDTDRPSPERRLSDRVVKNGSKILEAW